MGSYGQVWSARLALLRPGNGLMASVAVLLGGSLLLGPTWALGAPALAAALAAFLLTGFGNVLNDIVDIDLDRSAHPERPLPAGTLSIGQAQGFAAFLLVFGLYEAWVAAGIPTFMFAAANAMMLVLYERVAKQHGWPGNLLVAVLVGSAFLFGATATGTPPTTWALPFAVGVLAMLSNLAREICKDLEDAAADLGHRRTLAQLGEKARWLANGFVIVAVAISGWVAMQIPGTWLVPLLAANLLFLWGLAQRDAAQAQRTWKWAMLAALAAFAVLAVSKAS